jgi:peptidyl-prolyl cis-trans isomerase SurA
MTPDVKEKLTLITEALKLGEEFETLAEKYSEDPASKKNNGKLEPFAPNRHPGDFVKTSLALEKEQVSAPFSSMIGWHIVKLNELTFPETKPEDEKYTLTTKIQRDSRSTISVESLVEKLKKEYRFSDKGKDPFFKLLIKNLNNENTMPSETDLLAISGIAKLKPIFIFANQTITAQNFIKYLGRFSGVDLKQQPKTFLNLHYENFVKEKIIAYEFENLENKYPEFKELLNEYKYGMILFEMNNERVWSEAIKDTAGLENYYEEFMFNYLDDENNPKPFSQIRSAVLTDYQNKLESEWLNRLKEKYPVWINEELFQYLLKK